MSGRERSSAGVYDEAYFMGGSRSNYRDYGSLKAAIHTGFMPSVLRYASVAGAGRTERRSLDIGCAYGFYVDALAKLGWNAVGVDVSQYAIEQGRTRGISGLHVASAEHLPFPDDTFDFVTAIDVIEHLPPEAAVTAVAETRRVLKSGGVAMFATPNYLSNCYWNIFVPDFDDPDVTHVNYQSVESLLNLLSEFRECHVYGHTPFVDQFRAIDAPEIASWWPLRIRVVRGLTRRIAWRLLGQSVDFSSYLHAVGIK